LARARGVAAAADEPRLAHRVVRRAEGTHAREAVGEDARDGLDGRDLERLVVRQMRQEAREATREHRLARAGRADHEEVVAAGGADLERAPRGALAAHLV